MLIRKCKGCLYGLIERIDEIFLKNIPNNYKDNQMKRDNSNYHITIINSDELDNIDYEDRYIEIKYINLTSFCYNLSII